MSNINTIHAREILDSRGNPTVEVELELSNGMVSRAAVPSGASTGAYEAHEMRDGDKNRYNGKGVITAVNNVNEKIFAVLKGESVLDQERIDQKMLDLDGTKNKAKLGANAILGVSMTVAQAAAQVQGKPLFEYMSLDNQFKLPVPLMNVINGGAHANNSVDVQEFMIAPVCGGSFKEALRAGCEIFQSLKKLIDKKGMSTAVGDEGGFAPNLGSNREALEFLMGAIESAGYRPGEDIKIALDVAATEFFKDGKYLWEKKTITADELGSIYASWMNDFPVVSIEDGFSEDDWRGWSQFTGEHGKNVQLVGDDLFVTNPERIQMGIDQKAANALLVKVNQIGSITETRRAVELARKNGFHTVMSHRSGETEDVTIADLSVAFKSEQIKTGSLCRSERTAKYNQLLRIEEYLGDRGQFWAEQAFAWQ